MRKINQAKLDLRDSKLKGDPKLDPNGITEENLEKVIHNYFECNRLKSEYTTYVDKTKKLLKDYLIKNSLTDTVIAGYSVVVNTRDNTEFDEPSALILLKEILTEEQQKDVIKTKEYIDNDALENLVFNGLIEPEKLAKCMIEKDPIVTLYVKKSKSKKEKNNG